MHTRPSVLLSFRSVPHIYPSVRFRSRCTHTPSRISQTVHFPSRLLDDYDALFEKFGVVLLKVELQLCTLPDVSVRTYLQPPRDFELQVARKTRNLEASSFEKYWQTGGIFAGLRNPDHRGELHRTSNIGKI
jgi:hypothetical protein